MRYYFLLCSLVLSAGVGLGGCSSSNLNAAASPPPSVVAVPTTAPVISAPVMPISAPLTAQLPVFPVPPPAPTPKPPPTPTLPVPPKRSAQNDAAASSDTPIGFTDAYIAQINNAGTDELYAIDLKLKTEERQFIEVTNSANRTDSNIALCMMNSMQQLQRAVAAKLLESNGQNPNIQSPFINSVNAISMAQEAAQNAQEVIENANNPQLARQRRQAMQDAMRRQMINSFHRSNRR